MKGRPPTCVAAAALSAFAVILSPALWAQDKCAPSALAEACPRASTEQARKPEPTALALASSDPAANSAPRAQSESDLLSDEEILAAVLGDEAANAPVVDQARTYVVQGQAPVLPEPGVEIDVGDQSYGQSLGEQINRAPGARTVSSGGLLASQELRVRGLGGPRLRVVLDGVPLDDAAGGSVDLSQIDTTLLRRAVLLRGPEAGGLAPGALGGVLQLTSAEPRPGVHARIHGSAGSEGTAWMRSRVDVGLGALALAASLSLGRSEGDFAYRPVSTSADQALVAAPRRRANNDQTRINLLIKGRYRSDRLDSSALLQLSQHDNGVAGLSGHPTPRARLRTEQQMLSARNQLSSELGLFRLDLSGQRQRQRYLQPDSLAPLATDTKVNSARAGLAYQADKILGFVDLGLDLDATYAGARMRSAASLAALPGSRVEPSQRTTGGAHLRARASWLDERLALDGSLRADAFSDLGVEPSAALRLSYALRSWSSVEVHVGRAFRAPTFYELYGPPQGYLRANPDLLPEDGVEGGVGVRLGARELAVELSLFAARLANTILYLNRNAYEVRPENAGALWRGGGELTAAVQLRPWLRHSVTAELLLSRVDVTGAPLPATPPLILSTRSELDARALWLGLPLSAYLDARAQSQTSSNIYGELTVPAQAVIDLGLAYDFGEQSSLSLQINNLFDSNTRVDLRQVPLPGRQILLNLAVGI